MDQYRFLKDEKEIQHFRHAPTKEPPTQKRKWILLAVICFGVLCLIIASLLIGLKLNSGRTCQKETAERVLEERNHQLTEERDRLKQALLKINNDTLGGWLHFGWSLYLGSTTERSWQESRQYCQERGGDLIIINTEQEQNFARNIFQERRWIGLREPDQEGEWKWVDGSPLTISFWYPNQPSNYGGNEDCAEINYFTGGPRIWNDDNCASKRRCICEKQVALEV